jgi:hypothetical protein
MWAYVNDDIEVSVRSTLAGRVSFAAQYELGARVDPGWNLY